jgi:hypothetical protein
MPQASWVEKISFAYDTETGRSPTLIIKGAIFDSASTPTSANKILEALKADKYMMERFKEATLSYVEKKILFGREITEFEISFK